MQEHYYAKNLSKLRKLGFELERILMVDDSPEKLSQHYGNHIRVKPFIGDESDHELRDLLPFLDSLRTFENVRHVEKRFWRERPWRPSFAAFLQRLATDSEREGEWTKLVVMHYPDKEIESIRRDLVRLMIMRDPGGRPVWQPEDRAQMLRWAEQLGGSSDG